MRTVYYSLQNIIEYEYKQKQDLNKKELTEKVHYHAQYDSYLMNDFMMADMDVIVKEMADKKQITEINYFYYLN